MLPKITFPDTDKFPTKLELALTLKSDKTIRLLRVVSPSSSMKATEEPEEFFTSNILASESETFDLITKCLSTFTSVESTTTAF